MEFSSVSLPSGINLLSSPAPLRASNSLNGNIESHLSTANSQQRLRATVSYVSKEPPKSSDLESGYTSNSFPLSSGLRSLFYDQYSSAESHSPRVRLWLKSWMKWTAFSYCLFCVSFFSITLFGQIRQRDPSAHFKGSNLSVLNSLSVQQRLSRISSISPLASALDPYVLRGQVTNISFPTACLWIQEEDTDQLLTWASRWPGPISVLMTAVSSPPSMDRLSALKNNSRMASVSLHVLRLRTGNAHSPNAYLNLARLFSETSEVVLFPANATVIPKSEVYASISTRPGHSSNSPAVLTSGVYSSLPFPALSPVLISREHPTWCTERFFYSSSRATNWEQCLWQLWLESFGNVTSLDISRQKIAKARPSASSITTTKIQRRLMFKYRAEACLRAEKQLSALSTTEQMGDRKKSRWLAKFCRETLLAGKKDML